MSDKDRVVGKITIETLRNKYDPNYYVYVLVKDKELPTGDFQEDKWEYAYCMQWYGRDIEIVEIKKTTDLSKSLRLLYKALSKIAPTEKWNRYVLPVYSKKEKDEVEHEITEWLEKEGYKAIAEVISTPKIIKRQSIPLKKSVFDQMLEKVKQKKTNNTKTN